MTTNLSQKEENNAYVRWAEVHKHQMSGSETKRDKQWQNTCKKGEDNANVRWAEVHKH